MRIYPSRKMTAGQTNWPYVINLGNSIIGVSVLTMPFCFKTCGVLLGTLLLLCSAWLTSISCNLLVKAAFTSRRRSYQYLAFHAIGQAGKLFVEICMIGLLIGTCVAFYVIMGDLGPAIMSRVLGIENTDALRTGLLVVMALGIALPLALLRNLDSLSNINAISLGFYAVFVAEVFTAAFPNLWSGVWVTKVTYWNPGGIFKCLPIFSLAFSCQTQLFVMYDALPEPSLQRMHYITKSAIGMCVAVYLCVGYFGYVAFCDDEIQGDILMNFRPTIFSEAVKFGFVLSIAVSFPLVIFPCRASIYTMFFAKHEEQLDHTSHDNISGSLVIPPYHFNVITLGIILGTMTVGILVPNIEFVLAMTGATMGSMICLIVPAVVFIRIMSMSKSSSNATAQFVLFLGVTVLLASTYITLNSHSAETKNSKPVIRHDDDIKPLNGVQEKEAALGNDDVIKLPGGNADKVVQHIAPDEDVDLKGEGLEHLIEDKAQNMAVETDKRHEPPNPLAPVEQPNINPESKLNVDKRDEPEEAHEKEAVKPKDEEKDVAGEKDDNKDKEEPDKKTDDDVDNKKEVAEKEKIEERKQPVLDDKDAEEAKNILKELKEQQKEQKLLIEEQKQIIEDLKQHQKEAHQADGKAAPLQQPVQQVLPQQEQQNVQQQNMQGDLHQQAMPQQEVAQHAGQIQHDIQQPQAIQVQQDIQQQQPVQIQHDVQQQQPVQIQQGLQQQQQHAVQGQKVIQQQQPVEVQQLAQNSQVPQSDLNKKVEPVVQNMELNAEKQQQQPVLVAQNVPVAQMVKQNEKIDSVPAAGIIVDAAPQDIGIQQNQGQGVALNEKLNKQLVDIAVGAGDKFIVSPNEAGINHKPAVNDVLKPNLMPEVLQQQKVEPQMAQQQVLPNISRNQVNMKNDMLIQDMKQPRTQEQQQQVKAAVKQNIESLKKNQVEVGQNQHIVKTNNKAVRVKHKVQKKNHGLA